MMKLILFLTIPIAIKSNINIKINAPVFNHTPLIETSGEERTTPIADKELAYFGISHEVLKDSVEKLFDHRPDNLYLDNNTPWGDLHAEHKWMKPTRTISPVNSFIFNTSRDTVILSRQNFVNNGENKATYNFTMSQKVEISLHALYDDMKLDSIVGENTKLTLVLNPAEKYDFSLPWNDYSKKINDVFIGTKYETLLDLEGGQRATAILEADKTKIEALVDYLGTLEGMVACNYAEKVDGHHFFAYDINYLTRAAHLSGSFKCRQLIRLEFFTNPRLIIIGETTKITVRL